jgi:hypothetical protein
MHVSRDEGGAVSKLTEAIAAKLKQTPLAATPLVGHDDEFDPFHDVPVDPTPEDEGDDSVHAEGGPR